MTAINYYYYFFVYNHIMKDIYQYNVIFQKQLQP